MFYVPEQLQIYTESSKKLFGKESIIEKSQRAFQKVLKLQRKISQKKSLSFSKKQPLAQKRMSLNAGKCGRYDKSLEKKTKREYNLPILSRKEQKNKLQIQGCHSLLKKKNMKDQLVNYFGRKNKDLSLIIDKRRFWKAKNVKSQKLNNKHHFRSSTEPQAHSIIPYKDHTIHLSAWNEHLKKGSNVGEYI